MAKGISERHARSCPARDGGRCTCTRASRSRCGTRRLASGSQRSFSTITAARRWRQGASPSRLHSLVAAYRDPGAQLGVLDCVS
jgi:hypothetical protein